MKSKWDKLKELYKNKYAKPILFFGFYFIFFSVILLMTTSNDDNANQVEEKNSWESIGKNYEYLYDIDYNNNFMVSLEGKKYNNKELFSIITDGVKSEEIYKFYDDVYVKVDDTFIKTEDFIFIDESFDKNYMDINYIKKMVADAELMDSRTNFDGSKSEIYTFGNINIETTATDNKLLKILITDPLYKLTMQYKNINNVRDFVVEK